MNYEEKKEVMGIFWSALERENSFLAKHTPGVGDFTAHICILCSKCGERSLLQDIEILSMTLDDWCKDHGYDEKSCIWNKCQAEKYHIIKCPVCKNNYPVHIDFVFALLEDSISECREKVQQLEIVEKEAEEG